jgi:anti-sigma regulatory factor (Ser/Thr protein kinase)
MAVELSVDVPRGTHAATVARKLAQTRFAGHLPAQQLDDLLVIVSELATNAVLHGTGDITLRVSVAHGRVYGEVVDEGHGFVNEVRVRGVDEVGKKGLLIVGALAEQWGIHEGSSHVWFELRPEVDRDVIDPELGPEHRPPQLGG